MAKKKYVSDRHRILKQLQRGGRLSSYTIRKQGLSGDPSARIGELRKEGYEISAIPARRNGRRCVLYRLES